jgi:serine/threonine protein phosphatase PrpC
MGLRLVAGAKTDVGKQREQNEDSCYTLVAESDRHASGLFVVADGMGGYHAGEVASRVAVEVVRDTLLPLLGPASDQTTIPLNAQADRGKKDGKKDKSGKHDRNAKNDKAEKTDKTEKRDPKATQPLAKTEGAVTQQLDESMAMEHYAERLREAIEKANEALITYGQEHPDSRGLGSTITAALIIEGTAFVANVGDSRTYLLRDGKLARLTRDHSLVERLVEAGQIERDEVYDHPNRNLIYRSLGAGRADVDVDVFVEQLKSGDALLLCSDGLWEMVRDPQLESIISEVQDAGEACDVLVERANENGGEDNITAVLVRCLES